MKNLDWQHVVLLLAACVAVGVLVWFSQSTGSAPLLAVAVTAAGGLVATILALFKTAPQDVPLVTEARAARLTQERGFVSVGLLGRLAIFLAIAAVGGTLARVLVGCATTPAAVLGDAGKVVKIGAGICREFVDDSGAPDWVTVLCNDVEAGSSYFARVPRKEWRAMQVANADAGGGGY